MFMYIYSEMEMEKIIKSSTMFDAISKALILIISEEMDVFSWREARSSTGRLVTGSAGVGSAEQKTKSSITRSIFELEARNFACK